MVAAGQMLGKIVDAAIVQSKEMANKLASSDKVYIVPHEVDFDLFRPIDREQARSTLGLSPTKKYILFAAIAQDTGQAFLAGGRSGGLPGQTGSRCRVGCRVQGARIGWYST